MRKTTPHAVDSLDKLLACSYWERLWIQQEFALARSVILVAGTASINVYDIIRKDVGFRWMDVAAPSTLTKVEKSDLVTQKWIARNTFEAATRVYQGKLCADPRDQVCF